jgi:preprotein translocase subunit SecB
MAADEQDTKQQDVEKKSIRPQKIYLKDVSFETPNSPAVFTREWKPELAVEINNSVTDISEDLYEVVLRITVTVIVDGSPAFLAEVHQAGIFILKGFAADELQRVQNVYCLRALYPYACAEVSDLVSKGGFPQLVLEPMNFEKLYKIHLQDARENIDSPAE